MSLSPEFKYKWNRFKNDRKAYYSLLLLLGFFILSLPAELLFNDKPLLLKVEHSYYFPFCRDYSLKDLGGDEKVVIQDYNSDDVQNFLKGGAKKHVNTKLLFGDDKQDVDIDKLVAAQDRGEKVLPSGKFSWESKQEKKDWWAIWAPFRHSHKSSRSKQLLSQSNLANPFKHKDKKTGKMIPGAAEHGFFLGTDNGGKCVLARIVYGFRISIAFGFCLAICGTLVGCLLGAIQGYFAGWVDLLGQRATEIWGSIPRLYMLIIFGAIFARMEGLSTTWQYVMIFAILSLFAWMGMAAHMRAMFLRARNLDYVKAARALGVSDFQIMKRHILPNSLTPIITFVPFAITGGVGALVSLDFLGFGVKYPSPSLGELISQGKEFLWAWWILIPTSLTLLVLLMLLSFIGDGVRKAFDPRKKD